MVRPIEISDSLTKAEVVQRVQQNQKIQPEAAQHFQKTNTERLAELVSTANPVPKGDEVVIHVDEREEEKRKLSRKEEDSQGHSDKEQKNSEKKDGDEESPPHDHIDIRI